MKALSIFVCLAASAHGANQWDCRDHGSDPWKLPFDKNDFPKALDLVPDWSDQVTFWRNGPSDPRPPAQTIVTPWKFKFGNATINIGISTSIIGPESKPFEKSSFADVKKYAGIVIEQCIFNSSKAGLGGGAVLGKDSNLWVFVDPPFKRISPQEINGTVGVGPYIKQVQDSSNLVASSGDGSPEMTFSGANDLVREPSLPASTRSQIAGTDADTDSRSYHQNQLE